MIHIINPVPYKVQQFCLEALDSKLKNIEEHLIGSGEYGMVYNVPEQDYVIKFFNNKAILEGHLDYIYLKVLQGLYTVPVLYAYVENKFVVIEKIKGITIGDYYDMYKTFPPNIKKLIRNAIEEFFDKKIVPNDLKISEHIFWMEDKKTIRIIDFGDYSDCSIMSPTFKNRLMNATILEAFEDLNNVRISK